MPEANEIPDLESKPRLLSWSLVEHEFMGWRIYDGSIYYAYRGLSGFEHFPNISREEIGYLASFREAKFSCVQATQFDSWIRLCRDISDGAYDPRGDWSPWPVYQVELRELEEERQIEMARRQAQSQKLAMFFIKSIVGREWTTEDFRGPAMKHAKMLLEHYDADTIAGCLEAIRDGVIGDGSFEIKYMSAIESTGEPTWIAQWKMYCETEPAVYLEQTHAEWLERKDKVYPELLPDETPDTPKTSKPRRKKSATQLTIGSI